MRELTITSVDAQTNTYTSLYDESNLDPHVDPAEAAEYVAQM